MRPTVEDLQAIWRFIYSRASLLQAAEFFAELDNVVPESIQGRALIEMTLIAYARPPLPFFEIARVFIRLDHVARFIVNANHSIM
jgi:hypothetical protein